MKELFMGADASKGYCDFVILDQDENMLLENFQLDDTFFGHNHLELIIDNVFKKCNNIVLYVGIESTGGFENNWVGFFLDLVEKYNIRLSRLNPKGVYHHAKSVHKNITTDKESAISIAEYLIHNKKKIRFNEKYRNSDLRNQWSFIQLLIKQSTQLKNQLSMYLYFSHPQMMEYCKDDTPQWFFLLISKYPTAKKLSRASIKSISGIPFISETKAKELKEKAKQSISSSNTESAGLLIQSIISQLLSIKDMIKKQKNLLIESMKSKEVELLKSIKGIADYTACGLMCSIGRIQRFASAKQLISFWGLHPIFKKSGDKSSGSRMSKAGRQEARYLLFNVVRSAINSDPWIKTLYEKHQKKGKSKLSTFGILMHKIARIIFGMLKNKTKYNPKIDKNNIKKNEEKVIIPTLNNNRRYQSYDSSAPISRRHSKKRNNQIEKLKLEQVASQNDKIIMHEINAPAKKNLH